MLKFDILTVSQLNFYLKSILDGDDNLNNIFLRGEISNFKNHFSSGHLYFSVKDEKSIIKCVMFSSCARNIRFSPKDGIKIILRGRVSIYETTGQYQVYVEDMQLDGVGELHFAFEQLKQKLFNEGLFDQSHKKKLKKFPHNVGVITSRSGAVLHDIKNVISRRYPLCNIILKPVSVQGTDSAKQMINAIKLFNKKSAADVLIIGRGGGSIEDLWSFNDESLAHAIFESDIPIISAVGHETDFTICDFVADMRAPTPSAAAELAVPDISEIRDYIDELHYYAKSGIERTLSEKRNNLNNLISNLKSQSPKNKLKELELKVNNLKDKVNLSMQNNIENKKLKFIELVSKLNALSPLAILDRGYSITYNNDGGTNLKTITAVKVNDLLNIRVIDGTIECQVKNIKKITKEQESS